MCAILGMYSSEYNEQHTELFKQIFRESQIRGKHASGISYLKKGKVVTVKEPIPSTGFIDTIGIPKTNILIGHCRYSTSDLDYNQPLGNKKLSIVHNGVITQADPNSWEETFGYKFKTRNDSEIVFRTMEAGKNPIEEFKGASMSVVSLTKRGVINFFRNGNRPLWFCEYEGSYFISSTEDILKRSFQKIIGKVPELFKCENCTLYALEPDLFTMSGEEVNREQQLSPKCSDYYTKVE